MGDEYGYRCEDCNNRENALLMSKELTDGKNVCCVCYWRSKSDNK